MPGNEVGDRIHNFFGQENLSQGQQHSQLFDATWPGLNSNLWVGSQREIGVPLVSSNLKSYSVQPSVDSERGRGGQSSSLQDGLNFNQSALKSELVRSQSHNQQPTLNGYMHEHQALQTRQNESNFLRGDPEYNWYNLTSRGLQVLDSPLGNGPELHKNNSIPSESAETPVNYDFFGGQQQTNGQHFSMLPRQQSGISDMQLLHQQVMLKKLQELQRQQQLHNPQVQQQEARQEGSINQVSSVAKQEAGGHASGLINGIPMQDASNYPMQPELMAANTNWLQRGASPVMEGSFSGLTSSPDKGQVRVMGFVPQQVDRSLYGVPVSNTSINPSPYSPIQMDKPTMQQISASSNSFIGNQYATFPDQVGMRDGTMASRHSYQGKNIVASAAGQGLSSGLNLENLQQMNAQQRHALLQEFHERQGLVGRSEKSHDKTVMQAASSQNAVTLDPEEEKILFGSDDNLWDAFGRSTMGSGCSNTLDSTEFLGAVPSLQSGSWSALMQSAVAEISSGDMEVHEEWSGLGVRNSKPLASTQQTTYVNDGNKQSAWAENNFQTVSTMNSRPSPISGDANMSANHSTALGIQQSGFKPSHEQSEKLQNDSSQRLVQQFSREGSKWLDHSTVQRPVTDGNHFSGNAACSSDAEPHAKGISASWNHEGLSSINTSGQSYNRPNGWNFIESVSPGGSPSLKDQTNETSLRHNQRGEHKSSLHEQMGHSAGIFMTDSVSRAAEQATSTLRRRQVNHEDSSLNNDAATIRASQKSSQLYPNSHNLNFWKNVDSSINFTGSEVPGKHLQHLDKSPQNIVSSGHDGSDNGGFEHEMGNSNTKEKSNDSYHSNMSHHTSTGFHENVWLDASDSRTFPGGKQKSSGHIGRKPSGTRRFQYHPMGNVDMDTEPSYGMKNVAHSQAMPQQVSQGLTGHDQVYLGQSNIGHSGKNSMENEKGRLPGFQGDIKYLDEMPSKSMHPGYAPLSSAPFDKSVGNHAPNRTAPSSQNMLELLHKVDQSKEHSHVTDLCSSDRNQYQIPEAETSDGSVEHLEQNQSSASQGFGLQLGPPSQRLSMADNAISSQNSSQASLKSTLITSDMGKKGGTWLASTASVQSSHRFRETSQSDSRDNFSSTLGQISNKASRYNIQGNFSDGFLYPRSPHQNLQMTGTGGHVSPSQSIKRIGDSSSSERTQTSQAAMASVPNMSEGTPHGEFTSATETSQLNSNIQNHGGSAQQFPVLEVMSVPQSSIMSGMSQQGAFTKISHNAWANVSNQQSSSVSKVPPNLFKTRLQPANNLERTFSGPEKQDDQIAQKGDNCPPGFAACSAKPQGFFQGDQSAKEQHVSLENDAGQKLMNASHLQGKEYVADCIADPTLSNSTTQRDIEAFGHSLKPNNMLRHNYSLLHQVQAMKSTETDPDNKSLKRFKGPDSGLEASHSAPMGVQQLSTNHNPLPMRDSKMLSLSSKLGDNCGINASPHDTPPLSHNDSQTSIPLAVANEHLSSPQFLPPVITDQSMVHVRPKKRKSATTELLPWHREVMQGFSRLQNISMAETEWARAANRLMEKVEEETGLIGDGPSVFRSKRRLILTTQLMQQMLHPPQAKVLSSDASSHYEIVTYVVARSALGDACSSLSCSNSDASVHDSGNLLSENLGDQYISKALEDFTDRAKKLEDEISRLDKRASILDLRVECQDLEKFSVINRFAKFHGRAQSEGAEASSSSDANAQKFFAQRYVTALPIPRNLPDRVQCITL